MNIYDMLRRKDPNIVATAGVKLSKQPHRNQIWRGLTISPGHSVQLLDILRFYPFRERPPHCNWTVRTLRDTLRKPEIILSLVSGSGEHISDFRTAATGEPTLLSLPWPFNKSPMPAVNLVIEVPETEKSDVFLAVHRVMTRDELLSHATGKGVEIGPGANPQIKSGPKVDVSYLEQMPVADWQRLYGANGKNVIEKSLWDRYIIGEADNLPCPDGSLDFIFSSHVFEHLSNPLGHLYSWFEKLGPKGVVLGVIPDMAGTKDALHFPSTIPELLQEYEQGIWTPTLAHYQRYARYNMATADPAELLAMRRSIHVHFYTHSNMAALLNEACRLFGYAGFHLQHNPNHKDFHFMLLKDGGAIKN